MNVVLEAMGKRFDSVDKRLIEIEKRDTVTAKKLDSLRDLVETKFKSLDAKLTTLNTANQTMHTTTHETQAAISDGLVNSVKVSNNAFERQLETLDDIARLVE
jgi:oligoribonuclease (3'-5' exoribonuclease)